MVNEITRDLLKELFDYRDGELHWKVSNGNRAKIGDVAGCINKSGYRQTMVNGKLCYAHRLIFMYHHGYLSDYLDHIDGDKSNNNINNLRVATNQENSMNRKKQVLKNGKPTSSNFKGVSWNIRLKKWIVTIQIDGKSKYLGIFKSEIDAARSYNAAAIDMFGEFAKLNEI